MAHICRICKYGAARWASLSGAGKGRPLVGAVKSHMMSLGELRTALARTCTDVRNNHVFQMAAALSYYFVLSIFPALIFLSAVAAYLPGTNLFGEIVNLLNRYVPYDSMGGVRSVLADIVTAPRGAFLSVGILGTLWTASQGFAAIIEALNIAYDAKETRPLWKTQAIALGLLLVSGELVLAALGLLFVGSHFGAWLAAKAHLSQLFVLAWPYLHWTVAVAFIVLAVEALYFLAPNIQQRFWATLPGAVLAVGCWIGFSWLLRIYFRNFAHFNRTYGALGAGIAVMEWLYWTGFALLIGAEMNAEIAKLSSRGQLKPKAEAPRIPKIGRAA